MLTLVAGGPQNTVLTTPAQKVIDPLDNSIQKLLPLMIESMHRENGIGLAAPQIGEPLAIAVAEVDEKKYYWINPEITSLSEAKIIFEEGCLSLPGDYFSIIRSETVTLKYTNEKGLPKKLRATGLLAVVIQHEVDHLHGILICERYKKQTKIRNAGTYDRLD
jgi:peptide deformylase